MDGVGGVHKQGGLAGGVERGDELGADVGALADAGHHHPARRPQSHNGARAGGKPGRAGTSGIIEVFGGGAHRIGFREQHPAGGIQDLRVAQTVFLC